MQSKRQGPVESQTILTCEAQGGRAKKRKKMENGKGKEEQKQHVKCKARGRDLLNLKPF